ncbi:MAG: ferrous iron transporter B [Ruminococcaceae bacterium]|nr:ferrous iron transporter B [Oscillospiraceae bacterium]
MEIRIALAGNPNSGKTTLFNALTGANQYVGNWPGVTVEKKEGKLKRHEDVSVIDLPGIYSLSPYTLEEVVARNFLVEERPHAILNLVDGTNLERNLYLTTQLTELGIPVVIAINMMDVVRKQGDKIDIDELSRRLGCPIVEISALKGDGIQEAAEAAIVAAEKGIVTPPRHNFSGEVEHAIAHIEEAAVHGLPEEQQRWYAIKIFERDEKVLAKLKIDGEQLAHIEKDICAAEKTLDDDAESIITNERYEYIEELLRGCYKKKNIGKLSTSDKIDRVVTNRFAALPIFAAIMFLVYYISVSTVGTWVTDFTNDGLFGDGWHLFGIGSRDYEDAVDAYAEETLWAIPGLEGAMQNAVNDGVIGAEELLAAVQEQKYADFEEAWGAYGLAYAEHYGVAGELMVSLIDAVFEGAPDPAEYGVWVPGVPILFERMLGEGGLNTPEWVQSMVIDGIVGGVGAVIGFVPQIFVLFILLSFLEGCGYMARVAFVLDRLFCKFGLSGKSFIPLLIGTGCSVPGIMASRTIENERDRRMTIMTTSFVPCSAKLPVIALIAAALFDNAWWVAPSAYFVGIAAVVVSGIMLKKTKPFAGEPAPFVMELPLYHMPTAKNLFHAVWERGWSFIKRAGTVILLSSIVIWAGSCFGVIDGSFTFSTEMGELGKSVMDYIGGAISWIFAPLGFNDATAAVATVMGLVAKEEIAAVLGVLEFAGMGALAGYSFMIFNLLCAPCFAAMGAIKREMNSAKWTAFAIGYQCGFAYVISLIVYNLGCLFTGNVNGALGVVSLIFAFLALGGLGYMLFRPFKEATKTQKEVRVR